MRFQAKKLPCKARYSAKKDGFCWEKIPCKSRFFVPFKLKIYKTETNWSLRFEELFLFREKNEKKQKNACI